LDFSAAKNLERRFMMESSPHCRSVLVDKALGRSAQGCRSRRIYVVWAILYAIISVVYTVASLPLFHDHKEVGHWLQLAMAVFWASMCMDNFYHPLNGRSIQEREMRRQAGREEGHLLPHL